MSYLKARPVSFEIPASEKLRMFDTSLSLSGATSVVKQWDLRAVGMSCVRGIFIDNSTNPSETTIQVPGSYFKFTVPPNAQAVFPVIMFGESFTLQGFSAGGVDVPIQLYNFQQTPFIWYTTAPGQVSGTIPVTGSVTSNPGTGSFTNQSGAITLGGTAQNALPINGARKHFLIQNPQTAADQGIASAENLYINFTGAANIGTPSLVLFPGGSYESSMAPVASQALSVIAATTGHKFTCWEM